MFVVQIILGVLLVLAIILQQKGGGVGTSFGGDSSFYRTRRGAEKILFYGTIVLSVLFVFFALVGLIIK